jgi:hypothetical protein
LGENPCNDGPAKPIVATVPPRCAERLAAIVIPNKVRSIFLRGGVWICENEISCCGVILVSSYGRGRPTNPFSTMYFLEVYCSYNYEQFNQNKEPDKATRRD